MGAESAVGLQAGPPPHPLVPEASGGGSPGRAPGLPLVWGPGQSLGWMDTQACERLRGPPIGTGCQAGNHSLNEH